MINYYDKLYVGFRGETEMDRWRLDKTDPYPLAFMCHYEENAAFEKRKETIRHWCGSDGASKIVDNEPQTGMFIADAVSRYTTSNKVFQISDPRGFTLEISAYNLFYLIENCTLSKGVIQEPLVWGRDKSVNYLTTIDEPDYINRKNDYVPQEGDVFNYDGDVYKYIGKKFGHMIAKECKDNPNYNRRAFSYNWNERYICSYNDKGIDPKPFHVYLRINYNGEEEVVLRRSHIKKNAIPAKHKFTHDLKGWLDFRGTIDGAWSSRVMLYDNKKAEIQTVTSDEIEKLLEREQ